MRIPPAPGWPVVFAFGLLWNAVIERSLWASGFCLTLLLGSLLAQKLLLRR
jgi:hypothetical protein